MLIVNNKGELWYKKKRYKCAYGRNGFTTSKTEGDGCTPIGTFDLLRLFVRTDRIKNLKTKLPYQAIHKNMAWEDNPKKKNYNKLIFLKKNPHKERMFRKDHLYDLILVIEFNTKKIIKGKGSAIFIHIAKSGYQPTAGCIALNKKDLLDLLKKIKIKEKIKITG
ncbi:MAG: L,D-transpeptidase family protein [Pelagibacteraceae bacterium]|jgi:L,D-peptidoglycan transpeptidase YkuD (ErfK/YbiS/YcfS/YnhG family)